MSAESALITDERSARRRRVAAWILVAVALLLSLAAAVRGTMALLTSTTAPRTQVITAGTVTITLADPGAGAAFTTAISGLIPADMADRLITLNNTGTVDLASVAVAVTAPTTSALDTDAVNGLTLAIDQCSVPWTQASSAVAATCSGTTTSLTAATPVTTLKTTGPSYTASLAALTAGSSSYLRFHYLLPAAASNAVSGLTSTLQFVLTGTQVAGGNYR